MHLHWQAYYTLVLLVLMMWALATEQASPDTIMVGALFALVAPGVLTPKEGLSGFSNESVWSIAALLVVAAALRETGALSRVTPFMFGRVSVERPATSRMAISLAAVSTVIYNAPLTAMFLPAVADWARRHRLPMSRVMIPLSYAVLLGGACTLLGTSTNLVVSGLMVQNGLEPLGLFTQTPAGIPCAIVGLAYLCLVGVRRLPDRKEPLRQFGDAKREYMVEMSVQPGSPLVEQSVEEAGLRHLPGLFLVQIERRNHIITPVAPGELLEADDLLLFAGVVSSILDLQRIRGLAAMTYGDNDAPRDEWMARLCEVVVSSTSPLVDVTIRDADFRTMYDAAVVAVHRNGQRIQKKIGDIKLRAGDTLLLKTGPHFVRAHQNYSGFYLVSEIAESPTPLHEKAPLALGIVAAMIILSAVDKKLPMVVAATGAAGLLLVTGCIRGKKARSAVEWKVLVIMGASLGISMAMKVTGLAEALASSIVGGAIHLHLGAIGVLAVIYILTNLFTEVLSNAAAPALLVPVGISASNDLHISPIPFMVAIALAPSLAFMSPVGNHTHILIYGPGGYRFKDFVRVGAPLNLLTGIVAIVSVALWWRL